LISMKQIAGTYLGDKPQGNILDEVVRRVPVLAEKKLTPYQGLLHAIWTDERMSAVCTTMRNTDHIRENTDAARRYEPLKEADIRQLRDATLAHGPMLCADCDGRCSIAAGTRAELGNLTRFLTYHEHHGDRSEARRLYAELSPEARDWSGADLEAARAACPGQLDFARLLPEVERQLA
jgi:predicted aldo/keto reductase-like oxidoreductase